VTWMGPVVAPSGTVAVMAEPVALTVNDAAGEPLKETAVAPVRLLPGMPACDTS
jgi:hypothetical protein